MTAGIDLGSASPRFGADPYLFSRGITETTRIGADTIIGPYYNKTTLKLLYKSIGINS